MIQIEKILLPTDLSKYSAYALPYAVEMAKTYNASLHLLHVVETNWLGITGSAEFPGQTQEFIDTAVKAAEKEVEDLAESIDGVNIEASVILGTPHAEVVRYARDNNIDLIVLATHGRTGLSHVLMGSVAEKVVQMAPCPVLSIKNPEHEFVMP